MARLSILFLYTLSLALILPSLLPNLPLLFFAPFLISAVYQQNKISCLWLAMACGLVIDLLSSQMRFGFYALNYVLAVKLLYSYKYHFFEDSVTTLPILTSIFAILLTTIQLILLYLFGYGIIPTWAWIKNDLILMPLCDGLYAFIAFSLPALFLSRPSIPRRSKTILQRKAEP